MLLFGTCLAHITSMNSATHVIAPFQIHWSWYWLFIMLFLPFSLIRYTGCCWISLVSGGGSWEVRVKGDLSPRSDNGRMNSSPTTAVSPVFRLRHGGTHTINIPGKDASKCGRPIKETTPTELILFGSV